MTIKPVHMAVNKNVDRPSREEAEKAVETLLRYIGERPDREGLRETPARVIRAYDEFFEGYEQDADGVLGKTFEDIAGYDDMVIVRDIDFISHCEHHMVPIMGRAHVAYWPSARVVGISKLARVVDVYAKRLISQENMTREIRDAIDRTLKPRGAAVMISAAHQCMSTRGVFKPASATVTSMFSGIFKDDPAVQRRFLDLVQAK